MKPCKPKLAASRFVLPLELALAAYAVAWGVIGVLGTGALHRALESKGDVLWWGIMLIGVGMVTLAVSAVEFALGREWPLERIRLWANLRRGVMFVMFCSWLYALYVAVHFDTGRSVLLLTMSPLNAVFAAWCFSENDKVAIALNPDVPTPGLTFHR